MFRPAPTRPIAYVGPEALRQPIEAALREVVDPEVAMTIVDVGLVYGVTRRPDRVNVVMTMTSAACPVTDVIVGDVEAELDRVVPPAAADPTSTWSGSRPWTTDRMSRAGQGLHGLVGRHARPRARTPRTPAPVRLARLAFLSVVAALLVTGVIGGLLRAASRCRYRATGAWPGRAVSAHAFLMICGFMGTVIAHRARRRRQGAARVRGAGGIRPRRVC